MAGKRTIILGASGVTGNKSIIARLARRKLPGVLTEFTARAGTRDVGQIELLDEEPVATPHRLPEPARRELSQESAETELERIVRRRKPRDGAAGILNADETANSFCREGLKW